MWEVWRGGGFEDDLTCMTSFSPPTMYTHIHIPHILIILTMCVHTPSPPPPSPPPQPTQIEEVELKDNGGEIDVTDRNKKEYVE